MKRIFTLIFLLQFLFGYSQYNTINNGNWKTAATWNGGNIGPLNGNGVSITISSSNTVVLTDNITFNNNCVLTVYEKLIINGDFTANNNLAINVYGELIINGTFNGKNNAVVDISGNVKVNGNMNLENNTSIVLDSGILDVKGDLTGGNNSEISGNGYVNVTGIISGFTIGGGVKVNSGLPVSFISVTAEQMQNIIGIKWVTASEEDNDYFTIERSIDGDKFVEIDTVSGAGNSNQMLSYQYNDINPSGTYFIYRIKQTDFNGKFSYSKNADIQYQGGKEYFSLFPNPSCDYIMIDGSAIYDKTIQADVYSSSGERMITAQFEDVKGDSKFEINIMNLVKGMYVVVIKEAQSNIFIDRQNFVKN